MSQYKLQKALRFIQRYKSRLALEGMRSVSQYSDLADNDPSKRHGQRPPKSSTFPNSRSRSTSAQKTSFKCGGSCPAQVEVDGEVRFRTGFTGGRRGPEGEVLWVPCSALPPHTGRRRQLLRRLFQTLTGATCANISLI